MCRKLILLVFVLASCTSSSARAYTIIWVSDNKSPSGGVPADQAWVDLLVAEGYTVDLSFRNREGRSLSDAEIAALNEADLIIISRDTDSGNYDDGDEPTQWNSITTPIIMQVAHIARSNRWLWLNTTSTNDSLPPAMQAVELGHSVFTGVTLDASNQVSVLTEASSFASITNAGNGTLIARRADNNQVWIVEWEEGQEFYAGAGQTAGGPRMFFASGTDSGVDGRYNLTADGQTLFLNAVSHMIAKGIHLKAYKPDPPDGDTTVVAPMLDWEPGTTAKWHNVYLGTNPTPGPGELIATMWTLDMYWFGPPGPGLDPGNTYYWRIDEIEADGETIHTGDVWSFSTPFLTAHNPNPPDGAKYVFTNTDLSWDPGFGAITHDVYFGTVDPPPLVQAEHPDATYDPGTLSEDTTYYWRVDEDDGTTTHAGEVWRFRTLPDIPITDPDLICWWKFDEGWGTTAIDWSDHENHGNLLNGPQWAEGYDGGALDFDGVDDQVRGPSVSLPTSAFTIAFWFSPDSDLDSSDSRQDFVYWQSGSRPHITFDRSDTGEIGFWPRMVDDFDGPLTTTTSWNARTWYHIACTFDGTNFTIHVNANPEDTVNHPGVHDDSSGLIIGSRPTDNFFDGMIDDVRVYSKALTPEEIKLVMRGDPLLAWNARPVHGSTVDMDGATPLTWSPGDEAAKHYIYFGTDRDTVESADTSDTTGIYRGQRDPNSYTPPEGVEFGQDYSWRIDEYNADMTISTGRTWIFTVADYLNVDDFESYDDFDNRIFLTWIDGYGSPSQGIPGNGTGSTVGNLDEPYAEQTIVHEGTQSMPMDYNNLELPYHSETERTWDLPEDWTRHAVKALTLYFRGYPASVGSFSYDPVTGIYTMTADGADIFGTSDEFHYAYKQLSGVGLIEAQVLSVSDTDPWAKAGVMVRETLEPNSTFAAVYVTPGNGCRFQARLVTGDDAVSDSDVTELAHILAPHWVKLERGTAGAFNAYDSNDPALEGWHPLAWNTQNITMSPTVYIGLALTSHNADPTVACTATFSDVAIGGTVIGEWQSRDIGLTSNAADQLYVALEDSAGKRQTVKHPDSNAVLLDTWQDWNIDLAEFAPVNLASIKKMYIGVGDKGAGKPGGKGKLYIDDVRLYPPRCFPDLVKPAGDFSDNCVVDYPDLDIMTDNWLISDYDVTPADPGTGNLVTYYPLDGNTNDGSGNGHHGDPCGAPAYEGSNFGQAINLDGAADYVELPTGILTSASGSVSMWIRTAQRSNGHIFYGTENGGNGFGGERELHVNVQGDGMAQLWIHGGTSIVSDTVVADDQWHHIGATWDINDVAKLYVDGALEGTDTYTTDLVLSDVMRLGRPAADERYYDGLLDEVRIYDEALSQTGIGWLAGKTTTYTQPLYLLLTPRDPAIDMNSDNTVDLKDYAVLVDMWLDELLWP